MSLASVIKKKTTSSKASDKGPKFYNQQKNLFIDEMSQSPEAVTRIQVAASEYVPASILRNMLKTEEDSDVLRTLLMNPRTPLKAIEKFADTEHAEQFEDDPEITAHLKARAGIKSEENDSEDETVDTNVSEDDFEDEE